MLYLVVCLQPRKRRPDGDRLDDSDEDGDGLYLPRGEDGIPMGPEDHVVFSPDDESGSEDDAWFDQLVERKLSDLSELGGDSQPLEDGTHEAVADDTQPALMDSQIVDSQLPFDSQVLQMDDLPDLEPKGYDKMEEVRPVARPLKLYEDSLCDPTFTPEKPAYVEIMDSPVPMPAASLASKESKADRIARLQAQIAALEADLDTPQFGTPASLFVWDSLGPCCLVLCLYIDRNPRMCIVVETLKVL